MNEELLFTVGFILVLAGFIVVFVAVLLLFLEALRGRGMVRGGGVVVIGPFPVVFGTDKDSVRVVLLLSVALIVLVLVLTVFYYCAW